MQQIAEWLEKLGMSEYAERFAESDIDTSVLRDLTDQDLKELGVSLGHRRKMLRAIAELAECRSLHRLNQHLASLRAKTPLNADKSRLCSQT